jgi:hypothetical protein
MWKNIEEPVRLHVGKMHAHWVLDTLGYKRTLIICSTYCFSTATVVARTLLNVSTYLACLVNYFCLLSRTDLDV